ncbi:MAG: HAD hydrolase-like protein [Acidobacteria bacterium]|nr:HAD hydrolase-like protein [Acidobacteriota bacterium]
MKLVLFDVDGTLVDAAGAGRWSIDRAFEKVFGVGPIDSRHSGVRFNGRTDPSIISEIAAKNRIEPGALAARRGELEATYLALLEERLAPSSNAARALPGVADLLAELRRRRVPFGLLTGNLRRGAELKLRAVALDGFFDEGAFGSDGADRSDLARIARERFEARAGRPIDPSDVAVVGDAPEDVRAGRANGYRCLAVRTGWCEPGELEGLRPDLLLADLTATREVVAWFLAE